jgi:hypothetical protein
MHAAKKYKVTAVTTSNLTSSIIDHRPAVSRIVLAVFTVLEKLLENFSA